MSSDELCASVRVSMNCVCVRFVRIVCFGSYKYELWVSARVHVALGMLGQAGVSSAAAGVWACSHQVRTDRP